MSNFQIVTKINKTRKPHKCFGCCEIIESGSKVRKTSGCDDGRMYAVYWCPTCCAVMDTMDTYDLEAIDEGSIKDNNREQWAAIKKESEAKE